MSSATNSLIWSTPLTDDRLVLPVLSYPPHRISGRRIQLTFCYRGMKVMGTTTSRDGRVEHRLFTFHSSFSPHRNQTVRPLFLFSLLPRSHTVKINFTEIIIWLENYFQYSITELSCKIFLLRVLSKHLCWDFSLHLVWIISKPIHNTIQNITGGIK